MPKRVAKPGAASLAWIIWAACAVIMCTAAASAQSTADGVKVETVVDGLNAPMGLAFRPGGSRSGPDLLLAETGGGRVLGLSTEDPTPEPVEVLTGLANDGRPGASCLVFRSRNRLLIGQAGSAAHPALLSEFDIETDRLPLSPGDRQVKLEYAAGADVPLVSMARQDDTLLVATGSHGRLLETHWRSPSPRRLRSFGQLERLSATAAPQAVTFSEKGYLVVSLSDEASGDSDSVIAFLHPSESSSAPLLVLMPELRDIVALAYSPTTGNLYAAEFAAASSAGGVYRIDAKPSQTAGPDGCEAVLVAALPHPTALVFTEAGTLYATTLGDDGGSASGALVKFMGEL